MTPPSNWSYRLKFLMGRAGFEHPALTTPKTPISDVTRTDSGTVKDDYASKGPIDGAIKAKDLIRMVGLCQDLSEETKARIRDLIKAYVDSPNSPREER
jgi:hypothetical protein